MRAIGSSTKFELTRLLYESMTSKVGQTCGAPSIGQQHLPIKNFVSFLTTTNVVIWAVIKLDLIDSDSN